GWGDLRGRHSLRTQPPVGFGRCGGPTRCVTSFSRMARWICSPACPVSSCTCACISAHSSAIGNGTRTKHLLPAHDLELVIGLVLFTLVIVSHGGSLLFKRIFN